MNRPRYAAIDAARGLALAYMVTWHTLHWMSRASKLDRSPFSFDWIMGLVLKPNPTLFIMCFGLMMGVLLVGRGRPFWEECRHLWRRSLLVLACYKGLFWLDMVSRNLSAVHILRGLCWLDLSHCVEVMDFYFVMLLLAPLALWLWRRSPLPGKIGAIASCGGWYCSGRTSPGTTP